jgi:hypothetical protein
MFKMARAILSALALVVTLGESATAQHSPSLVGSCNQTLSETHGSVRMTLPPGAESCTFLIVPRWHYAPMGEGQPADLGGGSAVAVLDGDDNVLCAGALIAPRWV